MDASTVKNTYGAVGRYIVDVARSHNLDIEEFKRKLGVSTDLFCQLLYYGTKPRLRQPKPAILRRVARLLEINERELFSLAGYNAFKPHATEESAEIRASTLGEFLEHALQQRGMSGNQLSQLAGISQGTVRNLLKQGDTETVAGPHPKKLKAVCEVLNLDQVKVFQLAGYISPDDSVDDPVEDQHCHSIINLFAALPPDKQEVTLARLTELRLAQDRGKPTD